MHDCSTLELANWTLEEHAEMGVVTFHETADHRYADKVLGFEIEVEAENRVVTAAAC